MKGPRGTDSARVVSVIETRALRGIGTEKDKCRIVIQYWDFEGNLLAENDPCAKEKEQFPTQFSFVPVVLLDQCRLYQQRVLVDYVVQYTIVGVKVRLTL